MESEAQVSEGLSLAELNEKVAANGDAKMQEDDGYLAGVSVPALFSAFLKPSRITFRIGECERESEVTLRPMNADKRARWQDSVSQFSTVEGRRSEDTKFYFEPSTAKSDLMLLCGTVVSMDLFYDKEGSDGHTAVEQARLPLEGPARDNFFKDMHPEMRRRLVAECKRVNGIHPNPSE